MIRTQTNAGAVITTNMPIGTSTLVFSEGWAPKGLGVTSRKSILNDAILTSAKLEWCTLITGQDSGLRSMETQSEAHKIHFRQEEMKWWLADPGVDPNTGYHT